jgi:hypothetical protein
MQKEAVSYDFQSTVSTKINTIGAKDITFRIAAHPDRC